MFVLIFFLHHTKCCTETPSFYKNISIVCIYFHGSAIRVAPAQGVPLAIVKGSIQSPGTFPLISKMSAWSTTEKKRKKKKIQVSFFQPVLSFGFFSLFFLFFPPIWKNKNLEVNGGRSLQVWFGEEAWTLGHVVVRGTGDKGVVGGPLLFFTRCCCCSPGLYTECPLRCSLCPGAGRHTCPRTSRCLACGREMVCTAGQRTDKWVREGGEGTGWLTTASD